MSNYQTLVNLSLTELITGCRQEQNQFMSTPGYCFELFRRAVELGDDLAWSAVLQQVRPLLVCWIMESVTRETDRFLIEDLLQIGLERFWYALSSSPLPLAERFPHVGALLKYMKQCMKTACWECQRGENRQDRIQKQLTLSMFALPAQRPLEQHWSQKVYAARCENLRYWLEEHCHDEAEKLVYQLTYEEELKPRQIVAQHPEHFPAVQDVYRIKLRLYRRIQRAFDWEE